MYDAILAPSWNCIKVKKARRLSDRANIPYFDLEILENYHLQIKQMITRSATTQTNWKGASG
ncbi:uncharacterized protein EpC_15720 [Erwinia pyrifoliae Ep1/96]|nr:uncharacterized protein EpC_15720 [Erwinia pyrifoliae Ep1/96]